ncbi:heme ABC transporter ATP-binding protein [Pantoea allii]|uniref:heme ABC transporter ATP-binding protein n=1 Tax=Pantoea allii TaxID=574096 RepID=UPI000A245A95|nr:heme ABC transporter ATP-binding protein [Pantoea allii]MBW1251230.1 heme ABC transporter ATP-binding protein [Pantoea allii]MBW1261015.1 heme ABC transporter ATP-binding protein [Pantoea allii]MBW1282424.1 heme ABC transporter ATP-binding protein [Pantoea allii]ORM88684.1 heme ABC transporter ATP-binding protein [Pantoea allii]PBK00339.1 heme ABC transporter ATP-binding protein [Pantoea allii]
MGESLQTTNLCFGYGKRRLIDEISFSLPPGEMVALIGPNGAGKSTLLRLMTGFLTPTSGECRLGDRPLHHWPRDVLAQCRAVMRQQNSMTFSIQAQEVVTMGRSPWPAQFSAAVVKDVMHLTGSLELAHRDYRSLSGGEQQRIQLARVLAQLWHDDGPRGWLFLDEPTSALDLFWQQHSLRLLHRLTRSGDFSVCTVLHDLNQASLWSDRVLLLHQGKLVAQGTPQAVMTEAELRRWYQAELEVVMQRGRPQIQLLA